MTAVSQSRLPWLLPLGAAAAWIAATALARAAPRDEAVARALRELERWRGLTETDDEARARLWAYWAAVGQPPQPPGTAWSAAFISYLAGDALTPSESHVQYARAALQARRLGEPGRYWAYDPSEIDAVKPGDILIKGRGELLGWSDIEHGAGFIPAHGDLVVNVGDGYAEAVGGNLSDSVALARWELDGERPGPEVVTVLRRAV